MSDTPRVQPLDAGDAEQQADELAASSTIMRRSNAFMIDFAFTALSTGVVSVIAIFALMSTQALAIGVLVVPTLAVVLNTLGVWRFGHTLGQRLLGLTVVDSSTHRLLGLGRVVIRLLIIISPIIVLFGWDLVSTAATGQAGSGSAIAITAAVWFVMLIIASAFRTGAIHDSATRSTVIHGGPRPPSRPSAR